MEKESIISSIATRGNGEIYLGVVGAVRTGKSTFIKRFIENLVVPNITDDFDKKKCLDEIPQSAEGKTIMTTEPKFVPSNGATIKVDNFETNIKLVDCVGYVIPEANGYEDEDGNPRMVKTPWFPDAIPFVEAAEVGTQKVIKDHSTIGIVVTSDGSFGEIKRENYVEAEEKIVGELKEIGKPFIVVLNTVHPTNSDTVELSRSLSDNYDVPVMPINVEAMNEKEIMNILKEALYEFPVLDIEVSIPEWVHVLSNTNEIKMHYLEKIRESVISVNKLKDVDFILSHFEDSEYILELFDCPISSKLIEPFIHYLKKSGTNLIIYGEIIFKIIDKAIKNYDKNNPDHNYAYDDLNYIIVRIFDEVYETNKEDLKIKCLDTWDEMFSKHIGSIRKLSHEIINI